MILTVVVVAAFKSSTALTNAYGYDFTLFSRCRLSYGLNSFAVATVMITTSVLIAIQFKYVKGLPWWLGLAFFLAFGFFDGMCTTPYACDISFFLFFFFSFLKNWLMTFLIGLFWGAALRKVPHGAWVPLMIGAILYVYTSGFVVGIDSPDF